MDEAMIIDIVEVMHRVDCRKGDYMIRQGEYGDAYFVTQSGAFDILHQEQGVQQGQPAAPKRVGLLTVVCIVCDSLS